MPLNSFLTAALAVIGLAVLPAAHAQDTIKVGVIAAFSGPFADYGRQIEAGMKAYMKEHGDTVAGKKIELITRDTNGPAPEVAKRLAQELVTRDKVRLPRRLRPHARSDGGGARRDRGEEADDHHERRDVGRSRPSRRTSRACR